MLGCGSVTLVKRSCNGLGLLIHTGYLCLRCNVTVRVLAVVNIYRGTVGSENEGLQCACPASQLSVAANYFPYPYATLM